MTHAGEGPTPDPATLERNLAALATTSPRIAALIRAAAPRPDISFHPAPDGALGATLGAGPDARQLASRRAPIDEARKLADTVDVAGAAGIVVLGFGVGHHVRALAAKLARTGVLICFEPDLALLRSAFEHIDYVPMMRATNFVLLTDPDDLAEISASIRGVEGILAVGVKIVAHPASKPRLGPAADRFSDLFTKVMRSVRTTVVTTLVQSEVTLRNLLMNVDTYATAGSVGELKDSCKGRPAIVVSAGPSLRRNLDQLAKPGVRDRFVIIAVQTVLKQMLARGIRPHFVTALDYHEISRRFYEGLTAEDVAGITLIAEPKANPAILEAFPGTIRCPADDFLDTLLGPTLKRDMGKLTQGATVAHLAYYLARHLGCDPVILIGQDLGFTDGQYYPAGAAIHQVWSGELNPFRTLEMFEWERIVRNRRYLMKATDTLGRPIYTDEQMSTYLVQFERDFLADTQKGLTVIDATEGGVAKKSAQTMPLAQAIAAHRHGPPLSFPPEASSTTPRATRLRKVTDHIKKVRAEVWQISECSRKAHELLSRMLELDDQDKINNLILELNKVNAKVRTYTAAFQLVEFLNQTGALNRFKADRALELAKGSTQREEQIQRIHRDRTNVKWIGDAADQLGSLLESSLASLDGAPKITRDPPPREGATARPGSEGEPCESKPRPRISAVIPLSPSRSSLNTPRDLSQPFLLGENPLRLTLARLARCHRLHGIVILSDDPDAARRLVGEPPPNLRIDFLRADANPARSAAIAAARLWSPACWRGGLGGLTCYDELCDPASAARALSDLNLDAAILVGPDWALIDPALVDAVADRFLERPDKYKITFTQAPPGLGRCLIERGILQELAIGTATAGVFASVAGLLGYIPVAPQLDPIGKAVCAGISPLVRDLNFRCIPDSEPRRKLLEAALAPLGPRFLDAGADELAALISARILGHAPALPQQVTIELCTGRLTSGRRSEWTRGFGEMIERPAMTPALLERILAPLAAARPDLALTFAGAGDPLLHPDLPRFIALAKGAGAAAIHVRTDLVAQPAAIDALWDATPDIISIDLMATDADAYRRLMGIDRLTHVRANLDSLAKRRTGFDGAGRLRLPWIVPRFTRCDAVYEQIERFYDNSLMHLGAAVIDPLPKPMPGDRIEPLPRPESASRRHDLDSMTILSDGSIPLTDTDLRAEHPITSAARESISDAWRRLTAARKDRWMSRTTSTPRRAAG